ncbi:MAG: hypothetical protein ABIH89_01585 [Elusimicrobiota bacterium]
MIFGAIAYSLSSLIMLCSLVIAIRICMIVSGKDNGGVLMSLVVTDFSRMITRHTKKLFPVQGEINQLVVAMVISIFTMALFRITAI